MATMAHFYRWVCCLFYDFVQYSFLWHRFPLMFLCFLFSHHFLCDRQKHLPSVDFVSFISFSLSSFFAMSNVFPSLVLHNFCANIFFLFSVLLRVFILRFNTARRHQHWKLFSIVEFQSLRLWMEQKWTNEWEQKSNGNWWIVFHWTTWKMHGLQKIKFIEFFNETNQ